jgi:hypothetical protein
MNEAFVYGKSVEEDVLTSDIFGLLKYLPPRLVLWPFLQKAECFDERDGYKIVDQIGGFPPVSADFFFWPRTRSLREPDLLLILGDDSDNRSAMVIEVKFNSGKHDRAAIDGADDADEGYKEHGEGLESGNAGGSDGDQLGDYFRALLANEIYPRSGQPGSGTLASRIDKQRRESERTLYSPRTKKFLIYLTGHASPPEDDIGKTLDSVKKSVQVNDWRGRMYWLSWRSLYEVADAALNDSGRNLSGFQGEILWDILRLLDLRNLRFFKGWNYIDLDASVAAVHKTSFWRHRWFQGISVPDLEFITRPYFWR